MRGHVRKRGKTWSIVYDEGVDEVGKRVQRWKGGFRTKDEAEEALNQVLSKLGRGDYVAPSRTTFGDYLDTWLAGLQRAPLTIHAYRSSIGHVPPELRRKPVQAITSADLKALYVRLTAQGLAPATVRRIHNVLHRALEDGVGEMVVRNVASRKTEPPRASHKPRQTWSVRELRQFLASVEGDRLAAAWRFVGMTGVRRGELLGLRWRDVAAEHASISQTVIPSGGKRWQFSETKTGRGRMIDLDPKTLKMLEEHREAQLVEREQWGEGYVDHDLVFSRENGEPLDPNRFSETFTAAAKRAKLPLIRLHDLRHTHATHMLAAGVHPKVVQERLGHSSITITLDLYSHVTPGMQRDAAAKVADAVDEVASAAFAIR
jgi:integrase